MSENYAGSIWIHIFWAESMFGCKCHTPGSATTSANHPCTRISLQANSSTRHLNSVSVTLLASRAFLEAGRMRPGMIFEYSRNSQKSSFSWSNGATPKIVKRSYWQAKPIAFQLWIHFWIGLAETNVRKLCRIDLNSQILSWFNVWVQMPYACQCHDFSKSPPAREFLFKQTALRDT